MRIVLISGKSGVGKSTFGNILKEEYIKKGNNPITTQFSKYIKIYAKDYFNWDGNEDDKPRELLQTLGYEIIREKLNMKDFLINRFCDDVKILSNYFDTFIVTDVRMKDEIEKVVNKYDNVITIRINGDSKTKLTLKEQNHPTEIILDNYNNFDYVFNNPSIEDMRIYAKRIIEECGGKNEENDK